MNQDENAKYHKQKPDWYDPSLIDAELDARAMIADGGHPVNQVMKDLNNLKKGKIYKFTAPFLPTPLIEKVGALNFDHWVYKEGDDTFTIYFISKQN